MQVKMMQKTEHWRESGIVQDIIDQAEKATGYESESYDEYDCFIDDFSGRVAAAIEDAGHEVNWSYQQSVGVGCILQGPWFGDETKKQQEAIFDAAVESCRALFASDCESYCRAELESAE